MKKVMQKIYVSPETKAKIERVAAQNEVSQSRVLRHWVEEYLDILVFPEDCEKSDNNG